ncbi:tyrosine-type recombinase/integrase [Achromobacter ruhlandii]|uniref:tyrosine-type recombinase/integrase n=1 Tax=Alcaligenaceae TaxID=506 RepID=UPI00117812B5|nr:tyrosine-type recombinase/integrase [Bordetella genomosp. 10]
MKIPVYARAETGVYCIHLRVDGRQVKRSLRTRDRSLAILRALKFYEALGMVDPSKVKNYEIDLKRGYIKTDGTKEDNEQALLALGMLDKLGHLVPASGVLRNAPIEEEQPKGLRLLELFSKFMAMKKLQTRSVQQYTTNITEFAEFLKNPYLYRITSDDITRYQEHLKGSGNELRTIDNKVSVIRTVLNFAIKHKYLFAENPAKDRTLLTSRERAKSTYASFYLEEVLSVFDRQRMLAHKKKDPDFYFCLMLELVTGFRVGELTILKKGQFLKHERSFHFVRILDAKTKAGVREVPIPDELMNELQPFIEGRKLPDDKIFKYRELEGKGAGNAVGKKFARYIDEIGINRGKLVFHSLRKFFNNYMKEQGVSLEMRCQVIGHEVEGTNAEIYSQDFPLTVLQAQLSVVQKMLLEKVGYA